MRTMVYQRTTPRRRLLCSRFMREFCFRKSSRHHQENDYRTRFGRKVVRLFRAERLRRHTNVALTKSSGATGSGTGAPRAAGEGKTGLKLFASSLKSCV